MKDNFSQQADGYVKYRPEYPAALLDFILARVKGRENAWDCGTGNGQTAKLLAAAFSNVWATDISQKQIGNAYVLRNIHYSVQPAEQSNFPANYFDLVTVSQALHWFDLARFYDEVKRVTKPGGWLAAWMYALLRISPVIDSILDQYHFETLHDYWDMERRYVDTGYADIPFPFAEIDTPSFTMRYSWTLADLEGYLNTWSALQQFIARERYSPVPQLIARIKPHWTTARLDVQFPIVLRMGRIEK